MSRSELTGERYDVDSTPNSRIGKKQRVRRKLWKRKPYCLFCGISFEHPDDATIEHLLPRVYGGTDSQSNLALSCGPCNLERDAFYRQHVRNRPPMPLRRNPKYMLELP